MKLPRAIPFLRNGRRRLIALTAVCLAFFATGRCLQAEEPQEPQTLQGEGRIEAVAFSPDGKTVATATDEHRVELWDVASGKKTATLEGATNALVTVVFSPDGKILAAGGTDSLVRLWDVRTGKNTAALKKKREKEKRTQLVFEGAPPPRAASFSPSPTKPPLRHQFFPATVLNSRSLSGKLKIGGDFGT